VAALSAQRSALPDARVPQAGAPEEAVACESAQQPAGWVPSAQPEEAAAEVAEPLALQPVVAAARVEAAAEAVVAPHAEVAAAEAVVPHAEVAEAVVAAPPASEAAGAGAGEQQAV
jgi:hypothetical protein